jgi:glycogen debranching enzyme
MPSSEEVQGPPGEATMVRPERRMSSLVLKRGNLFLLAAPTLNAGGRRHGLYLEDTRHLSRYVLTAEGRRLKLLEAHSPTLWEASVELRNKEDSLRVRRRAALLPHFQESIRTQNMHDRPQEVSLALSWAVDFRDIFEVRELTPPHRRVARASHTTGEVTWMRRGDDGILRWTRVAVRPAPSSISRRGAVWNLSLEPGDGFTIDIRVDVGTGALPISVSEPRRRELVKSRWLERQEGVVGWARILAEDQLLQTWLNRSLDDSTDLLITVDGYQVPAAGVPWFATAFGRDSLIFGLETIHINPQLSMDILRMLAGRQGTRHDPRREEAPGKILHELRRGELAGCGEIPHTPYYGSVDSTPLFLCLLSEVLLWTGDGGFCRQMYPHALAAGQHLREAMEANPAGFVSYSGNDPPGLRHQGWKDSEDGILFPDGSQPEPPVALCEVQGYTHWGLRGLASIAASLGDQTTAEEVARIAEELRRRFERVFWIPGEDTYATAVDGRGERVTTLTSNPGHLLMTGVLPRSRARRVARRLLQEDLFSGWGIRTMSETETMYDPLSYHNGSVWPHDTAIAAWGMGRCGLREGAWKLLKALRDAASGFPSFRLPELFAGFARKGRGGPIRMPDACEPQAWAAGAPFMMLRGLLGMEADALARKLRVAPHWEDLGPLDFRGLRVGGSRLDLSLSEDGPEVRNRGGPEIEVVVD